MTPGAARLLAADEPPPVTVRNENGASPFLFVVDHAGNRVPRVLGDLGVSEAERARHIGWDIGIAAVSRLMADALDAAMIQQNYSRLVIDCNRAPGAETSMPVVSELTPVPGNVTLTDTDKAARVCEIFQPYHDAIDVELDRRKTSGHTTALVAMHSFTPEFKSVARPWHIGLLYNRNPRFSRSLLALLKREASLVVGDNEPYSMSDKTDYTVPAHGERRGLDYVAVEIRQDLIAQERGQQDWAALLTRLLPLAYQEIVAAATLRPV